MLWHPCWLADFRMSVPDQDRGKLEVWPNMFYWRGRSFSGLVNPETKALYDNPEDSFMEYVVGTQSTEYTPDG